MNISSHTARVGIAVAGAALVLAACGGSDSAAPATDDPGVTEAPAQPAEESTDAPMVSIEGFAFSSVGAVPPGTVVEVTNLDSAPHTLTAADSTFDTGTLEQNQVVTFVAPNEPGTYAFFCNIHPSMTGELVVS